MAFVIGSIQIVYRPNMSCNIRYTVYDRSTHSASVIECGDYKCQLSLEVNLITTSLKIAYHIVSHIIANISSVSAGWLKKNILY